jgi:hypothetical protein
LLAALDALGPYKLFANTVNVYATPVVNPVTFIGEDVPVAITPLGVEITL